MIRLQINFKSTDGIKANFTDNEKIVSSYLESQKTWI